VHLFPRRAGVVAAIHASVPGFDERVNATGARAGDRDADVAPDAGRQPWIARDLGPAVSAIARLEHPGARPARYQLPRLAIHLPEAGVEDARIVGIHHEID